MPLLCQSARPLDAAEAGGHRDHWAALLGDALPQVQARIDAATPSCEIVPPHAASTGALMAAGEPLAFALLQADRSGGQPASGLLCVVQVSLDDRGQPTVREIRTAYPHLGAAAALPARVRGIALFPGRLEARLRLDLGHGRIVDAFDSFYWRNRGRYRENDPVAFALTALGRMGPSVAEAGDRPLSLRRLPDGRPDDLLFQGVVVAVTPDAVTVLGERLWRVETRLARLGSTDLVLPVHVAAAGFAGDWRPAPGDAVSGSLWLQTRLVEAPGEG